MLLSNTYKDCAAKMLPVTSDRLMIFIDGQNLMRGASRFGYRIDYLKLVTFLLGSRKLEGKYYYSSIPNNPINDPATQAKIDKQIKFHSFLEHLGFKTTIIPLKKRSFSFECNHCGLATAAEKAVEKGVDVALAADMLSLAADGAYDVATIVSGDYDYHKAIEALQKRDITVEVAYFKNYGINPKLIELADHFIDLEAHINKIKR